MTNDDIKNPQYLCEKCKYITRNKKDYNKHIMTLKHQNDDKCLQKIPKNPITANYICDCGKKYSTRQSLYVHRKKCKNQQIKEINTDIVNLLLKENSELKQMILDVCKNNNSITNSNNSTTTNSHNKTFNLNLFLNETCKDAMNITEFVDSIQLQLSDLENVGRLGYVNGISKIIIKNLNALDETKRPIHCTDSKREILYVKDEDIWKKDNDNDRKCVKKAIKRIAYKNCKLIPEFREKYPDCNKSESRYSDQYNKMIVEAMGGSGNNDEEKEDKIIQNISKEVQINKRDHLIL
jgi:hypothetical protein